MIEALLKSRIKDALGALNLEAPEIELEHPADFSHGDYSTNVAMILGKKLKRDPLSLAVEIVEKMNEKPEPAVEKAEVAGSGFINFHLSAKFFGERTAEIFGAAENFGRHDLLKDKLILVEYTDPNPFKQFH